MKPTQPEDIGAFLREVEAEPAQPQATPSATAFLRQIQQTPEATQAQAPTPLPRGQLVKPTSYAESLGRGITAGATFDFDDEAVAAIATGVEALKRRLGDNLGTQAALGLIGTISPPLGAVIQREEERGRAMEPLTREMSLADVYRQRREEERALKEQAQLSNPKLYFTGQVGGGVAGTAALTAATGGAATPALATLGGGVAMGGVQGLGASEADITKGETTQALQDVGEGMAYGAAGYGLAKALPVVAKATGQALAKGAQASGLTKAAQNISKKLDEALRDFEAVRALKATGAIQSDLKRYIGAGGDMTRLRRIGETLQEKNIIPFLGDKEEIAKRAFALQDAAEQRMDEIYKLADKAANASGLKQPFNYDSLMQTVDALETAQQASSRIENAGMFQKFRNTIEEAQKKSASFANANFTKADFAKTYKAFSSAVTEGQRKAAGDIERAWAQEIEKQMDSVFQNVVPENESFAIMDALSKAKRNWEAAAATEAGTLRAQLQQGNNPLGLSAVVMGAPAAAQGLASSGLTGATATGLAMAAATEFARRRGSAMAGQTSKAFRTAAPKAKQAIASTGSKLSALIQKNPAALGRFAQPLVQAAQTSPQSLAVTDYTLANQNAEYRELRDALMEQEEQPTQQPMLEELLNMEGAQ